MAISRGEVTSPIAYSPNPIHEDSMNEMRKPLPIRIVIRPLNRCKSTSNPEQSVIDLCIGAIRISRGHSFKRKKRKCQSGDKIDIFVL